MSITSPIDNDNISCPYTLVTGTVEDSSPADEVAITVNGIIAPVYGNQFIANHVPLHNGENTITAVAIDSLGNTKSKSIAVVADIDVDHVWLKSGIESGVLPFETELTVDGSFNFKSPSLYHSGGNVVHQQTGENTFSVNLTDEGIYYFY